MKLDEFDWTNIISERNIFIFFTISHKGKEFQAEIFVLRSENFPNFYERVSTNLRSTIKQEYL